jgi:hypothetical protein
MKRSEMIDVIMIILLNNSNVLDYRELSNSVLKEMEKNGMLPPPTLNTTLGQWDKE